MSGVFNILIIEDDEKTFEVLSEAFGKNSYKLWRVTTGKEALKLAKELYVIAVITEMHVPDMDGIEFIARLKKMKPRINIIVLTAYSFTDSAVKALEAGAYAYLLKPLNIEEARLILKRAIENTSLLIHAGKKKYYQNMSLLDGLTGVYNHRYFHEMLEWQIAHLRRFPQAFSLFMIDIDDFKKYNDVNGHVGGDKALHSAAQLFVSSTRDNDMIFRYGGEEFAIILSQTPRQQAQIVAERLVKQARAQLSVTISIGVAIFPDNAQTKSDLVVRADRALYRAKRDGKDRFCIYDKRLDN